MSRKIPSLITIIVLFLSLTLGTMGCSTQGSQNPGSPNQTTPDEVVFNLQWLPEDPAYWVALDKGFWKEQNIDVKIIRGYGSGDTVTKIAMKKVDFGIADVGSLILAQAKEGIPVKAVATFKDYYGGIIIYPNSAGIKDPKDLEEKSIIASANSAVYLFFPAFAKATGIDSDKVKWQFMEPAIQHTAYVQGQGDGVATTFKYLPKIEKLTGEPAQFFSYKDDGKLDRYGETIIVHEDMLKQNPDLVRRFVAGFLKGLQYSLENPSEVGPIMNKYVPETDPELANKQWASELKYNVIVGEEPYVKGLGTMSSDRMARTIKFVLDAYEINKELPPEMIYTTEFLPQEPIFPPKR